MKHHGYGNPKLSHRRCNDHQKRTTTTNRKQRGLLRFSNENK